ncbi:MAG: NAD(+) diphosphatase [Casimicrobium sp.]
MLKNPADFSLLNQTSLQAEIGDDNVLRLCFRNAELLVSDAGTQTVATVSTLADGSIIVGRWNSRIVAVERVAADAQAPEGSRWAGLRSLFGVMPDDLVAIAGRACQIADWDRTHRYCGVCATPTIREQSERARRCPACGHTAYPRISPAMMCLVTRGDEILLARNVNFPAGRYSALAGFLEAGESIEDAVHREVEEEVGIKVSNLRYFSSQSWPFPHSLMIAFTAEYASGALTPDRTEIAEANWFEADHLPQLPPRISIARALIEDTLARFRAQ